MICGIVLSASTGCGALESAVCGDPSAAAPTELHCPDTIEAPPAEDASAAVPDPDPATVRPDAVACEAFVDHMVVVTAQSLWVPAENLFTAGERTAAIEHCVRYAHPLLIECGEQAQVLPYFQTCLFTKAIPRPEGKAPAREACERYREHGREMIEMLQTRTTGGTSAPSSARLEAATVDSCVTSLTPEQVECGLMANSQLSMLSCFSPYGVAERNWSTAEECESYADHMINVLGSYVLAGFPKPPGSIEALQLSGLATYAVPQLQRFQLVNLCHSLDRNLALCHAAAKTAADLGECEP